MDIHGPYGKDTEKPQLLFRSENIENQREGTFVNGKLLHKLTTRPGKLLHNYGKSPCF